MGKLLDKLKDICPKCGVEGFPVRISGHYNSPGRPAIFLWECEHCTHIWKDKQHKRTKRLTPKEYLATKARLPWIKAQHQCSELPSSPCNDS